MKNPVTSRYSKPIWAGRGVRRHQKGTVLGAKIDKSLYITWSLCDKVDLTGPDGVTVRYNTEHGRSLAQGRFAEIYLGKHFTFDATKPPNLAELLIAGVPQSALPVIVELIVNVLRNQEQKGSINTVSIYVKKPVKNLRTAYAIIASAASKVNMNMEKTEEPIY